jgi:hypothetical protein
MVVWYCAMLNDIGLPSQYRLRKECSLACSSAS